MSVDNARQFEELDERATQLVRLQEVTAAISGAVEVEEVLRLIVDGLGDIFTGASCAIRLYDSKTDEFAPLVATGVLRDLVDRPPRPAGTSRYVVQNKVPRYLEEHELSTPSDGAPPIRPEILKQGVKATAYLPLLSEEDVIGILYVYFAAPHRFSKNDKQILGFFADQAAIAVKNARLYEHISQNLERRIRELEALTEIGRAVSTLGIDQILDLVYEQTSEIMDLSDALFYIAFYDEQNDVVSFGLVIEKAKGDKIDEIRWGKRNGVEVQEWMPRAQRDPPGLTKYVIRTKRPVLIVEDFDKEADRRGIWLRPSIGQLERRSYSWLGAPMIVGERVIGMISIQGLRREHAFDEGHQEWLSALANQAAVAIENARLYDDLEAAYLKLEQAQEQRIAAEKFAHLGTVAAALGHRMNSVAGMVRLCERELRDLVDLENEEISDNMDTIAEEVAYILGLAEGLFMPTQAIEEQLEPTDLNLLLRDAVDKANIPSDIDTTCIYADGLPPIPANKWFVEMFVELITNAITAMKGVKGKLQIESRLADDRWTEILITDNGCGIPPQYREHVFDLFFSHREEEYVDEEEGIRNFGFGLWWIKTFLIGIGGSIDFESRVGEGTTFIVRLPERCNDA